MELGPEFDEEDFVTPVLHLLLEVFSAAEDSTESFEPGHAFNAGCVGALDGAADGGGHGEISFECGVQAFMELVEDGNLDVDEEAQLLAK